MYTDNGVSGLTLDCPKFNKLQADIQAGLIGTVIVKRCSRIGRNIIEVTEWVWDMTKMGVDIISLDNPTGLFPSELDFYIILAISLRQTVLCSFCRKNHGKSSHTPLPLLFPKKSKDFFGAPRKGGEPE